MSGNVEHYYNNVFDPVLRSREAPQEQAKQLYCNEGFKSKMQPLFKGEPCSYLLVHPLQERVSTLEGRIIELEKMLREKKSHLK